MPQSMKVPVMALLAAFVLAGCGGDAESAADLDSERLDSQVELEERAAAEDEPAAEPAPEAAPPPSTSQPPAQPSPATGGSTPPQQPEPEPEPEAEPEPEWAEAEPEDEPEPVAIRAGTRINAVLQEALSTRSHEPGDSFRARVNEEVLAADGMVLVPEGARLEGRIVEAHRSSGADQEAVLILSVESLILDGASFPLRSTVVEVEMAAGTRDSGTRSAATVATGAAAGAILGQVLGRDTRSTVVGAAAGAAAGAGVAITTRDGHAEIGEGAVLIVQIDEPVILASGR